MKRWAKALLAGSALLLGFAGYQALRLSRLAKNGAELVRVAEGFPRDYTIGAPSATPLVVLGDSVALGVGVDRLEHTLTYRVADAAATRLGIRHVVNLAVSGACVSDMVRDQVPKIPAGPLPLVIVSISANDATHGTDPAEFERDLIRFLDLLKGRKAGCVIVATTPNFYSTPALPFLIRAVVAARAHKLAAIVRSVGVRYPFVRLADLSIRGSLLEDQYAEDGFHPNAEGYRAWTRMFVGAAHLN